MDKYISLSDAEEMLRKIGAPIYAINALSLVRPVEHMAPVVRSHWEQVYEEGVGWLDRCCRCKSISKDAGKHCFNCGARMDGGV